jgi:prepilin-type N-terminal cleavage/methylation domain-containing protein/prepilin-type processing-associated H-X9-DG protein
MKRPTRRGFTLIELLVVVAIIALLIAILLPSLGKAKQISLRSRCAAQLKGWGTGIATYQAEWDGWFGAKLSGGSYGGQWDQDPKAYGIPEGNSVVDPLNAPASAKVVPSAYGNQMGNVAGSKARFCPADTPGNIGKPGQFYYGNRPLPGYRFVGYQRPPTGSAPPSGSVSAIQKISRFKALSDTLVMADGASANNYGDVFTFIQNNRATAGPNTGSFWTGLSNTASVATPRNYNGTGWDTVAELKARHGGYGGTLFLDGHADIVPFSTYQKNIPADPTDTDATKRWTSFAD